eukprot:758244-Hanusia_phi.AAC.2
MPLPPLLPTSVRTRQTLLEVPPTTCHSTSVILFNSPLANTPLFAFFTILQSSHRIFPPSTTNTPYSPHSAIVHPLRSADPPFTLILQTLRVAVFQDQSPSPADGNALAVALGNRVITKRMSDRKQDDFCHDRHPPDRYITCMTKQLLVS